MYGRGDRMKTVLYLDVLLLTNFLIAYGLLAAAGLLAGMAGRFGRMLAASVLAAAFTLVILLPEQPYPVQLLYKLVTGVLVVALAFGVRPARKYGAAVCWYMALNLLLAGLCMLIILRTDTNLLQTGNLVVYLRISPLLLVLLAGVCCLGTWLVLSVLGANAGHTAETVGFEMQLCGTTVRLRAVLDTGCHLKDPITCLPVLLISYPGARSRLPSTLCAFLDSWFAGKGGAEIQSDIPLRLVPCATATGRTVLPGLAVRQIGVISQQGVLSLGRTAVAFTQQSFGNGEYEALYGSDFF